jgi:two-component system, cell cycle sensor histidine kinase and response regulator CckA
MAAEFVGGAERADERFRQVADRLPIPMAIWSAEGIPYANPAFLTLTGRSAGELCLLPWTSLLADGDRDRISAQRRKILSGAAANARAEVMLLRNGGQPTWLEQTMTALESDDGSTLLVTAVETTEQKRTESARTDAERQYRRLFDSDLTAIAILSPSGIILECNRALARLFAAEPLEDMIGQPFAAYVQDPLYLNKLLTTVRTEGQVDTAELQASRADGELIVVGARLTGSFDAEGQLASVQLLLVEMTDRKRLEAHLIGVQRTEAVGRLAGGLAHDFNNLLTVIGGHSDYLMHTLPDADPRRTSAESIQQASRRAAALTRQLLAFGRRQVFHLRVVEIRQLLDDAHPMLTRVVGERVDLRIRIGDRSPQVNIDPVQLEQVLVNLSLNARDALPGGGSLEIRTDLMEMAEPPPRERPWIRRGTYLRIDVTDSGPGMDESVRARVFEPFYTTKQLGRGNGLGLATVYGIVKQSDGYIWVDSKLGRGTTFTMLFPAWKTVEDEAPAPREEAVPTAVVPHETILLVERDDSLRALLSDALRRRGYYVLDAASAARATELFGAHAGRIALVIADIQHADGSGTAIAERLRATDPGLRVLYMSATSTLAPSTSAHAGFIQKPFSLHAFADSVRHILDSDATKGGG